MYSICTTRFMRRIPAAFFLLAFLAAYSLLGVLLVPLIRYKGDVWTLAFLYGGSKIKWKKDDWKVSVIIPTCRRLHSLADAVESALHQTYPPLEIIVSIADNPQCIHGLKNIWSDHYTGTEVKIILVPPKDEGGPPCGFDCGNTARTRRYAIEKISTESTHVAFLDDDDLWLPDKLKVQVSRMKQGGYKVGSSDAIALNNRRCYKYEDGTYTWVPHDMSNLSNYKLLHREINRDYILSRLRLPEFPSNITLDVLLRENIFITSATLLSRDIYDEAGGFNVNDPNGEEDYSLWQRSLKLVPYGLFLTDGYIIYDNTRNVDCETNPVLSPLYRGSE